MVVHELLLLDTIIKLHCLFASVTSGFSGTADGNFGIGGGTE